MLILIGTRAIMPYINNRLKCRNLPAKVPKLWILKVISSIGIDKINKWCKFKLSTVIRLWITTILEKIIATWEIKWIFNHAKIWT